MRIDYGEVLTESINLAFTRKFIWLIFFIGSWTSIIFNYFTRDFSFDFTQSQPDPLFLKSSLIILASTVAIFFLNFLINLFGTSGAIKLAGENYNDRLLSISETIEAGLRFMPGIFFIAFLVWIPVGIIFGIFFSIPFSFFVVSVFSGTIDGVLVLGILGLFIIMSLAFFAVAVFASMLINFAVRYYVLYGVGVTKSLNSAYEKIREEKGKILFFWLIIFLFSSMFYITFGVVLFSISFFIPLLQSSYDVTFVILYLAPLSVVISLLQSFFTYFIINSWTHFFIKIIGKSQEELGYEAR
ncbi:MAG: hypothetical protein KAS39_07655 [Actinomycetia bacterium]|nr:hypothetical protein [Actinomycetes bacterium]